MERKGWILLIVWKLKQKEVGSLEPAYLLDMLGPRKLVEGKKKVENCRAQDQSTNCVN